ncbi:hypothetical protein E7744_15395 (plasmid) [Citricoccus sp. SGAir0253]|nr:SCO6880 family protein [Citricoccus sp. SGAir0253]QCU79699.1 hypothetical protein E7744_15395 [Citricoccus sp. SGAir0253]
MAGLGSIGTAILLGGLVIVILILAMGNTLRAVLAAGILGVVLLLLVVRDGHGRSALDRITSRLAWWRHRSSGSHLYRSGPLGRTAWGTHQLPGLAAPSTLTEHLDSYARPFALIEVPRTGHFTVVLAAEPEGAALVDTHQVDTWVADWGHWLASIGDEPSIEAVSVTIETAPDSGARLRREVETNLTDDAPEFARQMLREAEATYPAGSSSTKAYIALTFKAAPRRGAAKRSAADMGVELAARLPAITHALAATGAGTTRLLSAQQLCEVLRVAYDPAAATLIDDAHAEGVVPEMDWSEVGPSGTEAAWDWYRHDSALSMTWAMTVAPRGSVQSGVLGRLLAPTEVIDRKRVTLLYRPIDRATSARLVETDLKNAEFRQTASKKPSARDSIAVRQAAATAQEEAAGASLLNFGLLVTATVTDPSRRRDVIAAVDGLGASARLSLRLVHGAQDSAFAAALPLGLVLGKHLAVPTELREKL